MAHVTTMVVKVDLQCYQCYKKVKKVLCSFYQIQDQVYDEKENKVTIKVVCCDPEGMKQKILCKGKDVIKSIEIVVPKKKPPPPPSPPPPEVVTPPPPPPPTPPPPPPPTPPPPPSPPRPVPVPCMPFVPCVPVYPVPIAGTCCQECHEGRSGGPCSRRTCCQECYEGRSGGPCFRRTCCQECYEGRSGGPCLHGHNYNFAGPTPCYEDQYHSNWGKPVVNYDSYGGWRGYYFQPSQEYCSETALGCHIM